MLVCAPSYSIALSPHCVDIPYNFDGYAYRHYERYRNGDGELESIIEDSETEYDSSYLYTHPDPLSEQESDDMDSVCEERFNAMAINTQDNKERPDANFQLAGPREEEDDLETVHRDHQLEKYQLKDIDDVDTDEEEIIGNSGLHELHQWKIEQEARRNKCWRCFCGSQGFFAL